MSRVCPNGVMRACGIAEYPRNSSRRRNVLADDARMPGGDADQREARAVGCRTVLLPILQRAQADPERLGKLHLRELDEPPQRCNVASLELARADALALLARERAPECLRSPGGVVIEVVGDLADRLSFHGLFPFKNRL